MASGVAGGLVRNVDPVDAWHRLKTDHKAQLIDVRTEAEWAFVGTPDLSSIGKRTILVEWQGYPDARVNPRFTETCRKGISAAGADEASPLYFICRSGARSSSAALRMQEDGFNACHNVAYGFEGPLDGSRHRGTTSGWKHAGLPWVQA